MCFEFAICEMCVLPCWYAFSILHVSSWIVLISKSALATHLAKTKGFAVSLCHSNDKSYMYGYTRVYSELVEYMARNALSPIMSLASASASGFSSLTLDIFQSWSSSIRSSCIDVDVCEVTAIVCDARFCTGIFENKSTLRA